MAGGSERGDVVRDGKHVIRRIRVLGIPLLSIETDDEPDEAGDCTTTPLGFGPVPDDLPTSHRREDYS